MSYEYDTDRFVLCFGPDERTRSHMADKQKQKQTWTIVVRALYALTTYYFPLVKIVLLFRIHSMFLEGESVINKGSFPVPPWSEGKELWERGWLQTLLRQRLELCFSLGSVFCFVFSFLLAIYSWCYLGQCISNNPTAGLPITKSFIMQPIQRIIGHFSKSFWVFFSKNLR